MTVKLAFFEIVVSDIEAAIRWYSDNLELTPASDRTENEDGKWCLLEDSTHEKRVALWQPLWAGDVERLIHPSFVPVFEVENLDELIVRLKSSGVIFLEEVRERKGYRITSIQDPDGNMLQLFAWIS